MTFVETDGTEKQIKVPVGTNLLEAAHSNDIELEGRHSICLEFEFYCCKQGFVAVIYFVMRF